jgi:signal transduction histidine kinase
VLNETVRRAAQFAALQKKVGPLRREMKSIHLDVPEAPLIVAHDSAGIEGAVLNLILNARDAIGEKTTGMIFVRLKKSEDERWNCAALIEVEDNGVGIAPERLDKIFSPFQTSKPDGIGLGLSSVRRIVRAHGGECVVRSKVGEGTTFTIRLPLGSTEKM